MALKGNGTSDYIKCNIIPGPTRYTMHAFYQSANAPSGAGAVTSPYCLALSDYFYHAQLLWDVPGAPVRIHNRRVDGTYDILQFSGSFVADTWYGLGMSYNGTDLVAWLNGVQNGSVPSGDPPGGAYFPVPSILANASSGSPITFGDGTVAEFGLWDVQLSTDEMLAIGKGVPPIRVRPESLVVYLPMIRDIISVRGVINGYSGTTPQPHPPMRRSRGTNSYWQVQTGTPSPVSVSFSDNVVLSDSEQTGPATETINQTTHFVDAVSIAALAMQIITPGLTFTDSMIANSPYVTGQAAIADAIRLSSKFTSNSGYLASGRFRGYYGNG